MSARRGPGEVERLLAKDSATASEHDRQLSGFHFDLETCRRAFDVYDKDQSGTLDAVELGRLAQVLWETFHANGPAMPESVKAGLVESILSECDVNHDQEISFDEFIPWYHRMAEKNYIREHDSDGGWEPPGLFSAQVTGQATEMHTLRMQLLAEMQRRDSSTAPAMPAVEAAARKVLAAAKRIAGADQKRSITAAQHQQIVREVKAAGQVTSLDAPYFNAIGRILVSGPQDSLAASPGGARGRWGDGKVSDAALETILEANCAIMASGADNYEVLGSMTEWLLGLVAGMGLGNLKMQSSSVFLLSQIALAGPHTAQRIALLDGLTGACTACSSADADATLTVNTALLINNLAALGGEEAVGALTADDALMRNLTRLLDSAQDAPTLQRLTGVFNHLSRSEDSAKCLHALGIMPALRRVTQRPHVSGSVEAHEAYVGLASMAMANIAVRQEHHAPELSAQDKPAIKSIVRFLRCAVEKTDVNGIYFRVYDVLYALDSLSKSHERRFLGIDCGLVDLAVQVTAEWKPGQYASIFSDEKASTHPVLELSTDILKHLAHSETCKARMHTLHLESTLDRLLLTEQGAVRTHVLKVLWVLRDHERVVESARNIVAHVQTLQAVSELYELTPQSSDKMAVRLKREIHASTLDSKVSASIDWLQESIFADADSGAQVQSLRDSLLRTQTMLQIKETEISQLGEEAAGLKKRLDTAQDRQLSKAREAADLKKSLNTAQDRQLSKARELSDVVQQLEDCKRALAEAARSGVAEPVHPVLAAAPARRVKLGASAPSGGPRATAFVERVVARWAHREVSAALDAWKASVSNHKRVAMLGTRIVGHWMHLTLSRAYETWHDHAHELALSRDLLRRTAVRMSMRAVSLAFVSWKDNATRQRRARVVCGRIVLHWRHRCAAAAFESWHLHAQEQRHMENVCSKIVSHMLNLELSCAFDTWKDHSKRQIRGEGICARVLKHWTHRTAAAAFESWHLHAQEQRHMENVCSKIVSHMLNLELTCAFDTWKDHSKRQIRGERICRRVLGHLCHRTLSAAFECWHVHAQEQRHMENVCSKIVSHMLNRELAVGFETWRDHARRKARGEGIVARVLAHWLHRTAAGVFDSWRQALTESQMARVPHLIQMGITGARARETTRHNRKMRRSMSEPRASLHEKQELMGRIEHAWMKQAQKYWQLAEDECNVAREWYEHMALLYDKLCKEGRFGSDHLLDHRFQSLMNVSQPKYIRHDDVSRSAIGSVLSTCIGSLGNSVHHDKEPALRHKIQELRGYCSHLETENDMLILQNQLLDQPSRDMMREMIAPDTRLQFYT